MEFKGTKNWRIRYANENDTDSFFFIEGDLEKEGFYPRVEVMQEDFGDHNGYDKETRLSDAKLIACAPEMLEMLKNSIKEINHLKETYKDIGHCGKYLHQCNELIQKATT